MDFSTNRSALGPRDTPNLYRAEVLDNEDPDRYCRVKLKIFGVTDEGTSKDTSVWAEVMQSTTPGIDKSIGVSSILQVGTMVWCMLENNDPNKPVVVGVLSGKGDMSDALAGDKYINAQSLYTKSGHKIVIDDSEGDEFIYVYHRTGTYMKIDHNGDIWVNGVRDCQFDIARDVTWNIGRHLTVNVDGNETVNIKGTSTWTVDGDRAATYNANETNTVGTNKNETVGSTWSVNAGSQIAFTTPQFNVSAPQSTFSGNVQIGGNETVGGTGTASSDYIGGGKSLKGHTHGVINHSVTTPPQ